MASSLPISITAGTPHSSFSIICGDLNDVLCETANWAKPTLTVNIRNRVKKNLFIIISKTLAKIAIKIEY